MRDQLDRHAEMQEMNNLFDEMFEVDDNDL